MSQATYLQHVTLQSGHIRRSPRSEVSDAVLAALQEILRQALAGEAPALPADVQPACTLTAAADGRCLVATVWAPPEGDQRVPLATLGVALHSRCGARVWELLHDHCAEQMPPVTSREQQPSVPWVAARLDPGIVLHPGAAGWLGDFEMIVGWAWAEERRGGRAPGRHLEPHGGDTHA